MNVRTVLAQTALDPSNLDLTPLGIGGAGAVVAVTLYRLLTASFFQALQATRDLVRDRDQELDRKDQEIDRLHVRVTELETMVTAAANRENALHLQLMTLRAQLRAGDGTPD